MPLEIRQVIPVKPEISSIIVALISGGIIVHLRKRNSIVELRPNVFYDAPQGEREIFVDVHGVSTEVNTGVLVIVAPTGTEWSLNFTDSGRTRHLSRSTINPIIH
jgi:hypothetical protein